MPEATGPAGVAAQDDEMLVRLARRGDPVARDELFRRHRGVAYRVAFRLLGHEQDAQDAVQDGLLKAFAALSEFDGRSGFRTWLVRVVTNAALDLGRKRGRRMIFGGVGPGDRSEQPASTIADDPARGLLREDLRHALDAALARLSPKLRATFVLFAEAGLSYKEIAEIQGVPIGTVMSRIHEARHRLQESPGLRDLESG
jgi:RNA polymerase sigma-70 factor (ECF subfamily)